MNAMQMMSAKSGGIYLYYFYFIQDNVEYGFGGNFFTLNKNVILGHPEWMHL